MFSLRKKLRGDARFQAFNDNFDKEALKELIVEARANNVDAKELSIAEIAPFFNLAYKEFYEIVRQLLVDCELSVDELEELVVANFNREWIFINTDTNKKLIERVTENNNSFVVADYRDIELPNPFENRDFNAANALENSLDSLNTILSYLRYRERLDLNGDLDESKTLRALFQLDGYSKKTAVLKNTYDSMVWQGFWAQPEVASPNTILIAPIEPKLITLVEIGKYRMAQLISGAIQTSLLHISNNKYALKALEDEFRFKRKPRHIESVTVSDGYVLPIVRKGYSRNHLAFDLSIRSEFMLYYEFAIDTPLPATGTLTIADIAIMYAELCELIVALGALKYQKEGQLTIDGFYEFPFRIAKRKLAELLMNKTRYTNNEIDSFIQLMTHKNDGSRINFWNRPLIQRGDDLLFAILPLTSSHILYIVDEWLRGGGYDLDERGPLFEKYVKQEISSGMQDKGFSCKIHPLSDLQVGQRGNKVGRKSEEVDLVIEFSHCILVAEVKCIGYPIESRERYNAYKRLEEGAEQIIRKAEFIEKHKELLAQQIPGLLTKPIVKTVITNYPLFSGVNIKGVTPCDINYLTHYINDGGIDKGMVSYSKSGRDRSRAQRVNYYTNEKEFCDNLPHYLAEQVFVESMKDKITWERNILLSGPLIVENAKIDANAFHRELGNNL